MFSGDIHEKYCLYLHDNYSLQIPRISKNLPKAAAVLFFNFHYLLTL